MMGKYYYDDDGNRVTEGDTIHFSYGIPPIGVDAPIERINSILYAMTPGHNPKKCRLSELYEHVGNFYKIEAEK